MIYELSDNKGNIIGTHHEHSGFLPVGMCYYLALKNLEVGDKLNYDGITYKRVS